MINNRVLTELRLTVKVTYRGKALYPGSDGPDLGPVNHLPHAANPKSILDDLAEDWTSAERIGE